VSINKDPSHERHKRDANSDNSSTPAVSLQPATSINIEPTSARLSNNDTDDDSTISDAIANAWARSLSLSSSFDGDGSGNEYESKLLLDLSN
jgi:Tfp pilus assembly protein PilX